MTSAGDCCNGPQSKVSTAPGAGCAARAKGAALVVSALAIGLVGWLVLSMLADSAVRHPDVIKDLNPQARWMMDHRAWMPVLSSPVIVIGVWLLAGQRHRTAALIATAAASLWLAALLGIIVMSFLAFIAPLYQYQPI